MQEELKGKRIRVRNRVRERETDKLLRHLREERGRKVLGFCKHRKEFGMFVHQRVE